MANNDVAHTYYKPEQQSYIWFRQAMLADGVGDIHGAAKATWKAIHYADEVPAALADVPLLSLYGLAAALLDNDFAGAAKLALVMTSVQPQQIHQRLVKAGHADRSVEFDQATVRSSYRGATINVESCPSRTYSGQARPPPDTRPNRSRNGIEPWRHRAYHAG